MKAEVLEGVQDLAVGAQEIDPPRPRPRSTPLRKGKGGGLVDAPGRWLVRAKGEYPLPAPYLLVLRGVGRKPDRTGVLIFVSLRERYARIVADQAIDQKVSQAEWQDAVDALVHHMRDGRIADGFVEAIERCGRVLASHFPPRGPGRDELPDRVYVI